ncbi:MAG: type II toxin-antitoxin system YafQ family toxin [Firmicutes bacterium]|nr:type II toxin-antitoxin system YafQ family toxin [Bacillota bacterium]
MLNVVQTNNFKRDLKRLVKRGVDLTKLEEIMDKLANQVPLDKVHRPHKLKGNYKGLWECHVSNDLLLVWDIDDNAIYFMAVGTHSDLF